MTQVFISYSTEDSAFAQLAQMKLEAEGMKVWLFQGALHPGENWRDAIDEGIVSSDVLIVILSPGSSASSYVTYEWAYALGKGTKVIPVLLKETKTHPRLEPLQYLDFRDSKMMPWSMLVEEIKQRGHDSHRENYRVVMAVNDFAVNAYMAILKSHFLGRAMDATPPNFDKSSSVRSFYAFDGIVEYDLNRQGSEAELELRSLVKRITSMRRTRENKERDILLSRFREVQDSAQFIAYELDKLPFDSATLGKSWRFAQDQVLQLWEDKSKEVMFLDPLELDRVRQFIEEHPAYQQVFKTEGQEIGSFLYICPLRLEELIDLTRSELEKSLKESQSISGLKLGELF